MTPLQNGISDQSMQPGFDYQSEWHRSKTGLVRMPNKPSLITSQNDTAPKRLKSTPLRSPVWLPVRMTPLQNAADTKSAARSFDYQSEWHRSKTARHVWNVAQKFDYQSEWHRSKTHLASVTVDDRLITSQNDTAPKQLKASTVVVFVWLPVRMTPLQNSCWIMAQK